MSEELDRILKSIENIQPASRQNGEASAADLPPADPAKLMESLKELEPHIKKRNPRNSKKAMEQIIGLSWPDSLKGDIEEMKKYIGKYRFKEAEKVFNQLTEKLRKMGENND